MIARFANNFYYKMSVNLSGKVNAVDEDNYLLPAVHLKYCKFQKISNFIWYARV